MVSGAFLLLTIHGKALFLSLFHSHGSLQVVNRLTSRLISLPERSHVKHRGFGLGNLVGFFHIIDIPLKIKSHIRKIFSQIRGIGNLSVQILCQIQAEHLSRQLRKSHCKLGIVQVNLRTCKIHPAILNPEIHVHGSGIPILRCGHTESGSCELCAPQQALHLKAHIHLIGALIQLFIHGIPAEDLLARVRLSIRHQSLKGLDDNIFRVFFIHLPERQSGYGDNRRRCHSYDRTAP